MAGQGEFRDEFDVVPGSEGDEAVQFFFRVEAAVRRAVACGFAAFGGDGLQPVVAGYGEAPSLIIREVEVQFVVFVVGHEFDVFLDVLDAPVVPGGVDHESPPCVSRFVPDDAGGDGLSFVFGQVDELLERLPCVVFAVGVFGRDGGFAGSDFEDVAVGSHAGGLGQDDDFAGKGVLPVGKADILPRTPVFHRFRYDVRLLGMGMQGIQRDGEYFPYRSNHMLQYDSSGGVLSSFLDFLVL